MTEIIIIGGGLAGSEAAWQIATRGIKVVLYEMRPLRSTEAHQTDKLAELVCSNSFRADDAARNAIGALHEEMRRCNSLIMRCADAHKLPAGGALAVDRESFASAVTCELSAHPLITLKRAEITEFPRYEQPCILATGPLTTQPLAEELRQLTGNDALAFFDAIAPVVHAESINMDVAWRQSRWDKAGPAGTGNDYINCPLDKDTYDVFLRELLAAQKTDFKEWEKTTPYFEGCLPIEIMAARGNDTLRFGAMKPVGLQDPRTGKRPYAVVQLRQDNASATLWNIVGFQTKLRHGEQPRVFRLIPGLERAEFARLGGMHRNTFVNSPRVLDKSLRLKALPSMRLAGQITGVEGYVESAAIGLLAGRFTAEEAHGYAASLPPRDSAIGSLLAHVTGEGNQDTFQPMNVNLGLFPPFAGEKIPRKAQREAILARGIAAVDGWVSASAAPAGILP